MELAQRLANCCVFLQLHEGVIVVTCASPVLSSAEAHQAIIQLMQELGLFSSVRDMQKEFRVYNCSMEMKGQAGPANIQ